jgi:hypothetical protein
VVRDEKQKRRVGWRLRMEKRRDSSKTESGRRMKLKIPD